MGCKPEREGVPLPSVLLTRTRLQTLDLFYDKAEVALMNVRTLAKSISAHLDQFATATGLHGPPYRSVAFGVLGLVVSIFATTNGNIASLDLQFLDCVPGFSLRETELSDSQFSAYSSWTELLTFLDAALPALSALCPLMSQCLRDSRSILIEIYQHPEVQSLSSAEQTAVVRTVTSNAAVIQKCGQQLQWVLLKVRETIVEAATVVGELERMEDLSKLLELGEKAREAGLTSPAEVVQQLGFELDELIRHQKRLITGGSC